MQEGKHMFSDEEDYKGNVINQLTRDDKVDPGIFSLMQPGWWALHLTAIAGVYMLGNKLSNRY